MKDRCLNPNHQQHKYYGAKGISVCREWLDYKNFLHDMGEPEAGMQIDRLDSSKGYYKENCRWATACQNSSNRAGWGRYKTKGVFQRPSGNWAAVMSVNNKSMVLGTFKTQQEAAEVFDKATLEWHGKFAVTNKMLGAL